MKIRTRSFCQSVLAAAAGVLALAGPAFAQFSFKYNQPWSRPLASHASLVLDCAGTPATFSQRVLDDWICTKTGPITRVEWWGTRLPVAGANLPPPRRFFIQIWGHNPANCRPAQPILSWCVNASVKVIGVDCQQRRVYYFGANLPAPLFSQVQGQHLWLQISEVDTQSPQVGVPEFHWSAHRPIVACPAVRLLPNGAFQQPLLDPCDQQPDDLAFRLFSRGITGTIIPGIPGVLDNTPSPVFSIELRLPPGAPAGGGEIAEIAEVRVDPETGEFFFDPESPDGDYDVVVRGMSGVGRRLGMVNLSEGTVAELNPQPYPPGDADGSGRVNFADITAVLTNFGLIGPGY